MASTDKLVVEIDGRELAVISGRLAALENDNRQIHAEIGELGHKLDLVLVRMDAMGTRIEDMKFYMSLTFGAIGVCQVNCVRYFFYATFGKRSINLT